MLKFTFIFFIMNHKMLKVTELIARRKHICKIATGLMFVFHYALKRCSDLVYQVGRVYSGEPSRHSSLVRAHSLCPQEMATLSVLHH